MISAIKKERNECFLGALQFLYFKRWGKYLPDKVIKDYFNFSNKGISLKSLKDNIKKINGTVKIYSAQKNELPEDKWFMALIIEKGFFHYVVVKIKNGASIIFDPAKGLENKEIPKELIFIDIAMDQEVKWSNRFNFNNEKSFSILAAVSVVISSLLALILTFYFKFALEHIQAKELEGLSRTVLIFGSIGFINIIWILIRNFLLNKMFWNRLATFYKYFFSNILNSNSKLTNHFSKVQIYNSMTHGADYLKYMMLEKTTVSNSVVLGLSCGIVIWWEYEILFLPLVIFIITASLLSIKFKKIAFHNAESIRVSQISLGNTLLKTIENIEITSGFEYDVVQKLSSEKLKKNIDSNTNQVKSSEWISFTYSFISYLFNLLISAILFIAIINQELDLANGIFLITIATMFYSSMIKVWIYFINRDLELDSLHKFLDIICSYPSKGEFSYDGSRIYKNILKGKSGHFQVNGSNGSGKSTYLKILCGSMNKPNYKKIYLGKDTIVFSEPKRKHYRRLDLDYFFIEGAEILSSGQQQVKNIISAINNDFDILVIDEALSSVQLKVRKRIYKYILDNFSKKDIFIVDHDVNLVIEKINIML